MKRIRIPFINLLTAAVKWTALTSAVAIIATLTVQGAHLNGAHPIVLALLWVTVVSVGICLIKVLQEMLDTACLRYASKIARKNHCELFKEERTGVSSIIPFNYYLGK